jgi:hypothetical protein
MATDTATKLLLQHIVNIILILLLGINFLLHLICKLNYHKYVCTGNKHSAYRVWYDGWFQASTGGFGTYPLGDCYTTVDGLKQQKSILS